MVGCLAASVVAVRHRHKQSSGDKSCHKDHFVVTSFRIERLSALACRVVGNVVGIGDAQERGVRTGSTFPKSLSFRPKQLRFFFNTTTATPDSPPRSLFVCLIIPAILVFYASTVEVKTFHSSLRCLSAPVLKLQAPTPFGPSAQCLPSLLLRLFDREKMGYN